MAEINYNETYRCDGCGVANVKLWREYQTFLNRQKLRCVNCMAKLCEGDDKYAFDPALVDDEGCLTTETNVLGPKVNGMRPGLATFTGKLEPKWVHEDYEVRYHRTDQLGGSYVPAITTAEGDTFWSYTSVPPDRCAWWTALPTHPPQVPTLESMGIPPGQASPL